MTFTMAPLLDVRNLKTHFETRGGTVRAVDDICLEIGSGQTLGVVGESGCGKTVLALSIMRLISSPPGRIVGGQILLKGRDLLALSGEEMETIRGREVSMIFQEPMTSLNPVFTVGEQIAEVIRLHQGADRREAFRRSVEMLRTVGIPDPEIRVSHYPHQLSGGMRQRVMIAMALVCRPFLMLADEPTTALDVTIQAQVLDLMQTLQEDMGTAILLITHDLGVIAQIAHQVAVMYAGQIVEKAPVEEMLAHPLHPYTRGLMASIPRVEKAREAFLKAIPGTIPPLNRLPSGCRFQDRCSQRMPLCQQKEPELKVVGRDHTVRCWKWGTD